MTFYLDTCMTRNQFTIPRAILDCFSGGVAWMSGASIMDLFRLAT